MALYLTHVNSVLARMRETPITALSTDTSSVAFRVQEAVRRAVARVWNAKSWSFRIRSTSLPITSGTLAYALPPYVGEIFSILSSVSPYRVGVIDEATFDRHIPNPIETGNVFLARLFDMAGAVAQPVTPGIVQAVSSSASDDTQTVVVKGLVSGGYVDTEELVLSGTGTVSGTKVFSEIIALTKSAATVGAVTITSGATTLAVMHPAETVFRRRFIRLYPTPTASATLTIKHLAVPPLLTSAYEDTEIPWRWDYVVDTLAFALALQSQGQEQNAEFKLAFDLASKMLEVDMDSEEAISSQSNVVIQKWNRVIGGSGDAGILPAGYNYPEM